MNRVDQDEEIELASLISSLTSDEDFWTQSKEVPPRIGFQRFGVQLREEDFEQNGNTYRGFLIRDRSAARKESSGFSYVKNGEKEFFIELDVWPFKFNEIMVVVSSGLYIMIHGEHAEKCEDNSICTRKFTRRYLLPRGFVSNTMKVSYNNGILTIRADKNKNEIEPKTRKVWEITRSVSNTNEDEAAENSAASPDDQESSEDDCSLDGPESDDKVDEIGVEILQKGPVAEAIRVILKQDEEENSDYDSQRTESGKESPDSMSQVNESEGDR